MTEEHDKETVVSGDSSLVDESGSSTHLGDDDSFEQLAQLDSFEDNISDEELQD